MILVLLEDIQLMVKKVQNFSLSKVIWFVMLYHIVELFCPLVQNSIICSNKVLPIAYIAKQKRRLTAMVISGCMLTAVEKNH